MLRELKSIEQYSLIAKNSVRPLERCQIKSPSIQIGLGTCDEESACTMQSLKTFETQAAPIHEIECTSFDWYEAQHIDLVHLAVANVDKRWDCSLQGQHKVCGLTASLSLRKVVPF